MKIIGLDTETIMREGVHEYYTHQVYSDDPDLKEISYNPSDLEKVFSYETRGATFLAQNAEFDVAVLRKVLADSKFKFKVLYNKARFMRCEISRGKNGWTILDLKNLFTNYNLRHIGEIIGCPKLKSPEWLGLREWRTPEEKEYFERYAIRDAEICFRAGKYLENKFGMIKLSLPAMAFSVFCGMFGGKGLFKKEIDEIEDKLKLAYKGGRVECFWRGTPDQIVHVYDVNSLYPYVMWKESYPFLRDGFKTKTDVDLCHEGIAHVDVQVDDPQTFLCIRKLFPDATEKLIFPIGKFSGWFTYPELRHLEFHKHGKILKVHEAFEWRSAIKCFRSFVETYIKEKEKAITDRDFWKLFLNSLYGKFGQNPEGEEQILQQNGKLSDKNKNGGKKWFFRRNYLIASYITAYARLHMHRLFEKIGYDNIVYSDTDSIHTVKPLEVDSKELGQLKFEGKTARAGSATYIKSKFYIINDLIKCKGLSWGSTLNISADDMRSMIRNNKVEVVNELLLRIRSAHRQHKQMLTQYSGWKIFSLDPDQKRVYEKNLSPADLLTTFTKSRPLELMEI